MPRIKLHLEWAMMESNGAAYALDGIVALLKAVQQEKSLTRASAKVNLSYRHGWELIREASRELGAPLLHSVRGQGATLSPLGDRLVSANRQVSARLSPLLDKLAFELDSEVRQAVLSSSTGPRVNASNLFAIDALHQHLCELGVPLDLHYCASEDALASLSRSECDIAGFHTPVGDLETAVLEQWRKWLTASPYALINLGTQRQGIVVAPGNPKHITSIADLTRPDVQFVNRQPGSGTRLLLDLMLRRGGIDDRQIAGFESAEFTHTAVAAYIASGMADAGFAAEPAARQFRLAFLPLIEERCFLACRIDAINTVQIKALCKTLQSDPFRARLSGLPGNSTHACGAILSLADVFPQLGIRSGRLSRLRRA